MFVCNLSGREKNRVEQNRTERTNNKANLVSSGPCSINENVVANFPPTCQYSWNKKFEDDSNETTENRFLNCYWKRPNGWENKARFATGYKEAYKRKTKYTGIRALTWLHFDRSFRSGYFHLGGSLSTRELITLSCKLSGLSDPLRVNWFWFWTSPCVCVDTAVEPCRSIYWVRSVFPDLT